MRWRGSFQASVHDVHNYTFKILAHLFSTNAQRLYALASNPTITPLVALGTVSEFMREPIDLDCEARRFAEEVEDERAEWMLPPKLQSVRAHPKHSPKPDL